MLSSQITYSVPTYEVNEVMSIRYYRQPCVATQAADYVLPLFILFFIYFFLFTVRSQKLPDRFSRNFQELCILV